MANIKELREAMGLSREELAQKVGVTVYQVQRWEESGKTPNLWHRIQLARIFDRPLIELWPEDKAGKDEEG